MNRIDLPLAPPLRWLQPGPRLHALRRWLRAYRPWPAPGRDYRALRGLSAATLKDIGAPDWMWSTGTPGPAPWELERARR